MLIHDLRHVVTTHHFDHGKALLRADGNNAFNEVKENVFSKKRQKKDVCVQTGAAAQHTHAFYGTQLFMVARDTLLRSTQGTQQNDPLERLFSLAMKPLIDTTK